MTEILKGSTCPPKEIHEDQLDEQSQEFRTRKFWDKPPLERSRIAAEWLKKRMGIHHVSIEQVAMYTRMDLKRLQTILDGNVVMGLGEFCDIFHAIPDADESHISPDSLYHHRLNGVLKKIIWLEDGWNGEGSKGMPERLVRRFLHHIQFVPDAYLKGWQLSVTNDGELKMTHNEITLLFSWEEVHSIDKNQDIRMPFTMENFASIMELYSLIKYNDNTITKFDMFNGKRDDMRLVEKQLNKWYDDLIWCPSQCYYYFMHDDDMYCIYLRWRHQNPWTAEIIKCAESDFNHNHESTLWKFIKIPYFEVYELEKLKEYIMARLDIITALWPHYEHHISLQLEDYKTLPCEVREQVQKAMLNLVASNKLPERKIKTHHVGEIKGFDMLLQMEVRDYIQNHKEEIDIGDGLYINPDTVDITVTNIKQVTDHANFYPFTSLAKYDRTDGTYSVDKDATNNIAFTYYEYQ